MVVIRVSNKQFEWKPETEERPTEKLEVLNGGGISK